MVRRVLFHLGVAAAPYAPDRTEIHPEQIDDAEAEALEQRRIQSQMRYLEAKMSQLAAFAGGGAKNQSGLMAAAQMVGDSDEIAERDATIAELRAGMANAEAAKANAETKLAAALARLAELEG